MAAMKGKKDILIFSNLARGAPCGNPTKVLANWGRGGGESAIDIQGESHCGESSSTPSCFMLHKLKCSVHPGKSVKVPKLEYGLRNLFFIFFRLV